MKELDHKAIGLRIRKQRILLKLSREEAGAENRSFHHIFDRYRIGNERIFT